MSNFNPRPHTGGDWSKKLTYTSFNISTHAPTQGATFVQSPTVASFVISTHAPTQGATLLGYADSRGLMISTHAPTQGATRVWAWSACPIDDFNPRPHTGGDILHLFIVLSNIKFQPTPPHRGRPMCTTCPLLFLHFNPRPHTGGD